MEMSCAEKSSQLHPLGERTKKNKNSEDEKNTN